MKFDIPKDWFLAKAHLEEGHEIGAGVVPELLRPIFIPLKRVYFEQFKAGTKRFEYRPRGTRWNIEKCAVGRRVVLSLGYSGERLNGKIVSCHYDTIPAKLPGWTECYGEKAGDACCIEIEVIA